MFKEWEAEKRSVKSKEVGFMVRAEGSHLLILRRFTKAIILCF